MRTMLFALALMLAGCSAGDEKYQRWMGESEASLVAAWGPPDSVYTTDVGDRMLSWHRSTPITMPGNPSTYIAAPIGGGTYAVSGIGGSPETTYNFRCRVTFGVWKGKVLSWQYKGWC